MNRFTALLLSGFFVVPSAGEIKHRFFLADEGNSRVLYIDQFDSTKNWSVATDGGNRDLQLIGNNRLLVSTPAGGFYELDTRTGAKLREVKKFGSVQSARRSPNGTTLLAGDNLNGKTGVVTIEIDSLSTIKRTIAYAGYSTVRLTRKTPTGTVLFGSNTKVVEGDSTGTVLWNRAVEGSTHTYQAVRKTNGNTILSAGYGAFVAEVSPSGALVKKWGGKNQAQASLINPNFYAGFQVLSNGHIVVTNWQGHGPGHGASGIQVLEYDSAGAMVWSWKNPSMISSVHNVLVTDNCNTSLLYDEASGGVLSSPAVGTGTGVHRNGIHMDATVNSMRATALTGRLLDVSGSRPQGYVPQVVFTTRGVIRIADGGKRVW